MFLEQTKNVQLEDVTKAYSKCSLTGVVNILEAGPKTCNK